MINRQSRAHEVFFRKTIATTMLSIFFNLAA